MNSLLRAPRRSPYLSVLLVLACADGTGPAAATASGPGARIFTVLLALALAVVLDRILEPVVRRAGGPARVVPPLRFLIWGAALAWAGATLLGPLHPQAAFVGAALLGLALVLAAAPLLAGVLAGLALAIDPPFRVGDRVRVGTTRGIVEAIGLRTTRIRARDGALVTLPNARIVGRPVGRTGSGGPDGHVVAHLFLPGWVDGAHARRIAQQVAASSKYVHLATPVEVHLRDAFDETFLTHLEVVAGLADARHEARFVSDVTERARAEFRRQGLLFGPAGNGAADPS